MKKIVAFVSAFALILCLCACTVSELGDVGGGIAQGPTWQEQYDLGVRYLSEGNYQEAILAFTAAIEIDPKRAEAYVGRGDAYVLSGETEENLSAAKADYEKAIELDDTSAEAYLGLADVYIRQGEYEKALEVLKQGLEKIRDDQRLTDKIEEMINGTFVDSNGHTRKSSHYENGELIQYWLYEYDEMGNNTKKENYDIDGTLKATETSKFDDSGREIRMVWTAENGDTRTESYEYDSAGRIIRKNTTFHSDTDADNLLNQYTLIAYNDAARTETHTQYNEDGSLVNQFIIEKDAQGIRRKGTSYIPDENGDLHVNYYVEYIWNADGTYGGYNLTQVAEKPDYNQ